MTVAGQSAYLDASGVHLGSPQAPASSAVVAAVDTALHQAGMEIYFTSPHSITVGGASYYYAASVLFYWAPPGDPSSNSLTATLGGSGISVTDSANGVAGAPTPTGTATFPTGSVVAPPPSSPVAVGTVGSDGGAPTTPAASSPGTSLSLPASPSSAASPSNPTSASTPAAFQLPGGIGPAWIVLAILAGLLGAGLTTRVPDLLGRRAASDCPRAKSPGRAQPTTERPDL
jgi:hypothetical protein